MRFLLPCFLQLPEEHDQRRNHDEMHDNPHPCAGEGIEKNDEGCCLSQTHDGDFYDGVEDSADDHMIDNSERVVVSYVAVPTEISAGSYCYKMLIDNQTHMLYYFKKHRITKNTGVGFLPEDIRKLASFRINQESGR